ATYGPPYTSDTTNSQRLLFAPAAITGVTQPINTAQDFVLQPLGKLSATNPALAGALAIYKAAPAARQRAWVSAYLSAVGHVKFIGGIPLPPPPARGPRPPLPPPPPPLARRRPLAPAPPARPAFHQRTAPTQ